MLRDPTCHPIVQQSHVAGRVLGSEVPVRDPGLLQSVLARPQATAFGADAYATLEEKAAALLHSLARNHALMDGNKRLAWSCLTMFCALNGHNLGEQRRRRRPTDLHRRRRRCRRGSHG